MPRHTFAILLGLALACRRPDAAPVSRTPAAVSLDQFETLRWLQGNWRGSGDGAATFYESYVFLDDSTIQRYTYRDSTFAVAEDSGLVEWRGGRTTVRDGGATWIATQFDTSGVQFEPVEGAPNRIRWVPGTHATWTATLVWPGADDRTLSYQMLRVGS